MPLLPGFILLAEDIGAALIAHAALGDISESDDHGVHPRWRYSDLIKSTRIAISSAPAKNNPISAMS